MKKEQTRREFLKYSGTIVFIMGSGCYIPVDKKSADPKAPGAPIKSSSGIPPSDGYLLVDIKKCQGCLSCMLACSLVHEGTENLSLSRIQVFQNPFEKFPVDLDIAQCRQCVDPACVEACPTEALKPKAEYGNVRMVDKSKCIGCGACVEACPFTPSRSMVAPDENFGGEDKSRKCDLCAEAKFWTEKTGPKGKQACVEICPLKAIRFTAEIPVQKGEEGYKMNLRGRTWQRWGYSSS
jgi:protein NrfC